MNNNPRKNTKLRLDELAILERKIGHHNLASKLKPNPNTKKLNKKLGLWNSKLKYC